MIDPMAPLRQAQWDAPIAVLRRLDPNNPNLVSLAPPGPPSAAAVGTARVTDEIAHGHAWPNFGSLKEIGR